MTPQNDPIQVLLARIAELDRRHHADLELVRRLRRSLDVWKRRYRGARAR